MKALAYGLITVLVLALLAVAPDGYAQTGPQTRPQTPAKPPLSLVDTVEQGYLAYRRGDYDEAIKIFTSIIQRRGLTIKERAVSYLLRGEAKREKGDIQEAIHDFTRAINQWPNYPQAIFFRGQAFASLNQWQEALADLNRAAELDPNRESYKTTLELLKVKMKKAGVDPNPKVQIDLTPPKE
ncbi:MAG: tetratricopeptide repeat protein [Deltaproteobacteria bacterium]|jgi:tetratricopeptide (TPR) repeat protein|nr:tetratricopeptide repeat protein [Deltaproteobacteria bacterium]